MHKKTVAFICMAYKAHFLSQYLERSCACVKLTFLYLGLSRLIFNIILDDVGVI